MRPRLEARHQTLLPQREFYARVLRYFTPDWPFVLLTFIFILLSTLAALLQPFPLAILIDSMESRQPGNGGIIVPPGCI